MFSTHCFASAATSLIAAGVPRAPLPLSCAVGRWCPVPAVCLEELLRWLAAGNSTLELRHAGGYAMPGTNWSTGPNTRGVSNLVSHWDLIGGALQKALGLLQVVLRRASAEQRDSRVPPASIKERCRALALGGSGDVLCISSWPLEPRQQKCHKLNDRKPAEATALVSSFG